MRGFVDRWARNRVLLVSMMMASYSVQSLLITLSKESGGFAYDATAAVLLAEALKLAFALAMLSPKERATLDVRECWPYALPAVLYALQNRLVFEALRMLAPPEYQLLNNLKLLTTSLLYRVVMRRQLLVLQWLALLLLGLGMALATQPPPPAAPLEGRVVLGGGDSGRPPGVEAALSWLSNRSWSGTAVMVVVSWCSAFAGVSNEWLIKRSDSVIKASVDYNLQGFTLVTWLVVLCNAVLGQTIAFLFRYADSIVKLYAVCASMAFTTLVSVSFFGFEVSFHMVAGYAACAVSMCMYYVPPEVLLGTDAELLAGILSGRGASVCAQPGRGDPATAAAAKEARD